MGAKCGAQTVCQDKTNLGNRYLGEDDHDEKRHSRNNLEPHHRLALNSGTCAPLMAQVQVMEDDLKRADGLSLKTDCVSLADVDGDGVEIGEVVRAVLMVPPGSESMALEEGGGELLYPEVHAGDDTQSAVEVALRAEFSTIEKKTGEIDEDLEEASTRVGHRRGPRHANLHSA